MTENLETDPLQTLRAKNAERIDRVQSLGSDISPIPFIDAKINTLIDLLLHGPWRHIFELSYEGQIANLLDEVDNEIQRQKIVVPKIKGT